MAVRSTQCQNRAVRSTQGGGGCHPHNSTTCKSGMFVLYISHENVISSAIKGLTRLVKSIRLVRCTYGLYFKKRGSCKSKPISVRGIVRRNALAWKIAASVLLKLFITGHKRCHTTDDLYFQICVHIHIFFDPRGT